VLLFLLCEERLPILTNVSIVINATCVGARGAIELRGAVGS
jgi:hypothetical protein